MITLLFDTKVTLNNLIKILFMIVKDNQLDVVKFRLRDNSKPSACSVMVFGRGIDKKKHIYDAHIEIANYYW